MCNGYTKKMPKGTAVPIHIQQEVLLRFDSYRRQELSIMDACGRISADLMELSPPYALPAKSVWAMLNRLRPTTDLAKMYLKAKAMKLVKRVVRKASVAEAIDVLSRPGIDVLAPAAKSVEGSGPTGFFLSVQSDTCGAVKVGGMIGPAPVKELAGDTFDPFHGAIGGFDEETVTESARSTSVVLDQSRESVLDRARAKIRQARSRLGEENPGILDVDGQTEA
jgi:hypothetical protein